LLDLNRLLECLRNKIKGDFMPICKECGIENDWSVDITTKICSECHEKITTKIRQEKEKVQRDTDLGKKAKTYPSLIFLSRVAKFIAWVGVFSSLIIGVFYIITLNRPSIMEILFPVLGIVLITFIHFVVWRAISEILILFVDIAKDVREIRLKK